jgi:hypothetical protein
VKGVGPLRKNSLFRALGTRRVAVPHSIGQFLKLLHLKAPIAATNGKKLPLTGLMSHAS